MGPLRRASILANKHGQGWVLSEKRAWSLSCILKGELELSRQRGKGRYSRFRQKRSQAQRRLCPAVFQSEPQQRGREGWRKVQDMKAVSQGAIHSLSKIGLYPAGNWKPLKGSQEKMWHEQVHVLSRATVTVQSGDVAFPVAQAEVVVCSRNGATIVEVEMKERHTQVAESAELGDRLGWAEGDGAVDATSPRGCVVGSTSTWTTGGWKWSLLWGEEDELMLSHSE